jgi:hypothetical protein
MKIALPIVVLALLGGCASGTVAQGETYTFRMVSNGLILDERVIGLNEQNRAEAICGSSGWKHIKTTRNASASVATVTFQCLESRENR